MTAPTISANGSGECNLAPTDSQTRAAACHRAVVRNRLDVSPSKGVFYAMWIVFHDGGCGLAVKAPDCGSGYRGFESRHPPLRRYNPAQFLDLRPTLIVGSGVVQSRLSFGPYARERKRANSRPSLTLWAGMSSGAALVVYFLPGALPITGNVRVARLSLVNASALVTAHPKGSQQKRLRPHLAMPLRVPLRRRNNRKFEGSL